MKAKRPLQQRGSGITLGGDGYFRRGGARFVPVGVNYWPGSCGVEMWRDFPAGEIEHDLDLVARLGLNTVRFFLRWQDFETTPGRYRAAAFARLRRMLQWTSARGLVAQPSVFVGWMSGGVFWPRWVAGRNVFADPEMVRRGAAFARRVAQEAAPFHDHLLGLDLGNELNCLPASYAAPPAAVIQWCATMCDAVRWVYPRALLVSGCEQGQVISDSGWRFGQQPGTDYLSMHGYPVPPWHSVGFDGMADPFAQSLLPLYVKAARAFAPVLLQEFGTIVTFGRRQQDAYLRGMLPAAWDAGANGFLWWCLRDIAARHHPYQTNGFEGTLGLLDADDRVKPGLEFFLDFARCLPDLPTPTPRPRTIGLYWPREYYPRDNPDGPRNDPRTLGACLTVAHHLLTGLGQRVEVVRGDQPMPGHVSTLVITGARLTIDEAATLRAWVTRGGRLLWHGPDPVNWGPDYIALIGAHPVDYRADRPALVRLARKTWKLPAHPRGLRVEAEPTTAAVLARDEAGRPAVLRHPLGRGVVTTATPLVEQAVVAVAADPAERQAWSAWYRYLLSRM